MGQGLGYFSPVVLSLGKENYEALIDRHGQWVRWRVGEKCPCAKTTTGQPDIHCEKCTGLGITYSYQKERVISQTVMLIEYSPIIELDSVYENCSLIKVYDNAGNTYENAIKTGHFVDLQTPEFPVKGSYITVVMCEDIIKVKDSAQCESLGYGYYRVTDLQIGKSSIDGLYHTVPCDIESIEKIIDNNGTEYTVCEFRQNCFFIEQKQDENGLPIEIAEPVRVESIEYLEPFTFVILNQNLSKSDVQVMQELNGDAILTFPYSFDVSNDDVITVLSGTYTQKSVISRKIADYDIIPSYFVDTIVSCIGINREYIQGMDFVLVGTNRIKWICDDFPEDGEAYSITYRVFPTYKIVKAIPQIRTSENQRMPKKAVIKLYDTFGEKRGVNVQW